MRYEVINTAGEVVNVVMWDGVAPYDPGEGLTLRPAPLPEPEPETDSDDDA
jgi:hypothetical protein